MGKWSIKTDIMVIWKPFACLSIYIFWVLLSRRLSFVSSIGVNDSGPYFVSNLFFYLQFIPSLFVSIIAATQFDELYRKSSMAYLRTLPLNLFEMWLKRYILLLASLVVVCIPSCLIAIRQVTFGISTYIDLFSLNLVSISISRVWVILNIIITANFFILLVQFFMIIFKHKTISVSIIIIYLALEYGPLSEKLAEKSFFFWSFNPIKPSQLYTTGFFVMVALSLMLLVFITVWFWRKTH